MMDFSIVLRATLVTLTCCFIACTGLGASERRLQQAQVALEEEHWHKVDELLAASAWSGDDHPLRRIILGNAALAQDRPQEAIDHFTRALALDPNRTQVGLTLARLHHAEGQPRHALPLFARLLVRTEDVTAEDWYAYALSAHAAEDHHLSRSIVVEGRRRFPEHRSLLQLQLVLMVEERSPGTGALAQHFLRTAKHDDERALALTFLAQSQQQQGDWSGALAAWELALSLDPQEASWRQQAIHAASELDLLDRALSHASHLLGADPKPGNELALALQVAEQAGDYHRLAIWLEAWPTDQRPPPVAMIALRQKARSGDAQALREALTHAIGSGLNHPRLLIWAAGLAEEHDDVARAEWWYRQAAEQNRGKHARLARLRLLALLLRQERWQQAEEVAGVYQQEYPGDERIIPLRRYLHLRAPQD